MMQDSANLNTVATMQWGAYLAGAAIEQSMLGACHASANPLTAHYGLVHGLAVSIMMPVVLRFNSAVAVGTYTELARLAGLPGIRPADELATLVEKFALSAGLPTRLRDCGVSEGIFPILAEEAFDQWTGKFNPRPVSEKDFIEIYQAAF
jgi:alcohol dehydrogenase